MGKNTEKLVNQFKTPSTAKFVKREQNRLRRRSAKTYLNKFDDKKPEPFIKNRYEGWTT